MGRCALKVLLSTISSNMREKSRVDALKMPCCADLKKFWMRTSMTYKIRAANRLSFRCRSQYVAWFILM